MAGLPVGTQVLAFIDAVNADGSLLPAVPLGVVLAEPDGSGATSMAAAYTGRHDAFGESTIDGISARALEAARLW